MEQNAATSDRVFNDWWNSSYELIKNDPNMSQLSIAWAAWVAAQRAQRDKSSNISYDLAHYVVVHPQLVTQSVLEKAQALLDALENSNG